MGDGCGQEEPSAAGPQADLAAPAVGCAADGEADAGSAAVETGYTHTSPLELFLTGGKTERDEHAAGQVCDTGQAGDGENLGGEVPITRNGGDEGAGCGDGDGAAKGSQ